MGLSPRAVPLMASHILSHLPPSPRAEPLFVLLQGPQGSGKTFLCTSLASLLRSQHNLRVAVLSIDDLYLPHAGLKKLAREHPENPLLTGRGQPGTHDLDLGVGIFRALRRAQEHNTTILPVFDKSLFGGEGDRAFEGIPVLGKVDVVLVEGWCTGFYPLSDEELDQRFVTYSSWKGPKIPEHRIQDVREINDFLKLYAVEWWIAFSVFIQVSSLLTEYIAYVHEWRLQQEHNMKAKNGGKGMSDEQVKAFVDRYLPGYYYFSDGVAHGYDVPPDEGSQSQTAWAGRGLRVVIDRGRHVVRSETF
ncbi:P-loop containing nucleoside triphosphate hydrolase protein [Dacryopinax primogenitus]|uniref:p-loop containing nucleoside triphosphate hydrolase protein n=1 Tax=Dacryopinax primogenitus (strain DJM 731) TaxID=1858805 RepID=M5FQ51_DACPD|nr:P-loop containing nucleoside triphosphate hydrolase protein [Dacryopinax primogenitus]EJT96729.1 P-loop containing nucleoside triphosphate hydrolase protein [Dacryopinax primogenitus]